MKFIVTIKGMNEDEKDDVQGSLEEELRNMGWSADVEPADGWPLHKALTHSLED